MDTNVRFFKVKSESNPEKEYTVRVFEDTREVRCDCPGFIFGGHCKHIQQVLERLEDENNKSNHN